MTCPKCNADVAATEAFCPACGTKVGVSVQETEADNRAAQATIKARKWLLACAILTLAGGIVFSFMTRSQVQDDLDNLRRVTAGMDPVRRDEMLKEKVGMTFDQIVAHDEGLPNQLLFINGGLAALFLGMWFWAKRNVVAASAVALVVFVTVHAINVVIDPKTLVQGVVFKVVFLVALVGALQSALEARRMKKLAVATGT